MSGCRTSRPGCATAADTRFATCLEHGKASEFLSVFSPKTVEAYDRVFAQLKARSRDADRRLADRLADATTARRIIRPAPPARAFPVAHTHIGWWAGEPEARQHFLRWVETKYGSVERLNAAWGTQFTRFRIRLSARSDLGAALARLRRVVSRGPHRAARGALRHRPQALPRDPDLRQSGLAVREDRSGSGPFGTGQDARLQEDDRSQPDRPDGHAPLHAPGRDGRPVLPLPGLSTEPVDGYAPIGEIAGALFKDLTTGATWHFDYLENMERAREPFQHVRTLPRHEYPRIDAAIFFSTTAHRLENWDNWHEGFQGGYPEGMARLAGGTCATSWTTTSWTNG